MTYSILYSLVYTSGLYDNICQLNLNTHGGQMTQYKVVREKIFLDISIYSDEKKAYIMLVLFIVLLISYLKVVFLFLMNLKFI